MRELQNLVERAVVLNHGNTIDGPFLRTLLPATVAPEADEPSIDETDNKAEAARRLGISERTLWYKLKKYGL